VVASFFYGSISKQAGDPLKRRELRRIRGLFVAILESQGGLRAIGGCCVPIGFQPGQTILERGSGTGTVARWLAA
jgi:hypothetical protein